MELVFDQLVFIVRGCGAIDEVAVGLNRTGTLVEEFPFLIAPRVVLGILEYSFVGSQYDVAFFELGGVEAV